MALLDVSSVLLDPDFTDAFVVKRRDETIDVHGRSQVSVTNITTFGVVTATSPNDLMRNDGYQAMNRSITVVCKFRLRGETTSQQPDVVFWRGSNYVVKNIDLYPQFGAGFIQAECTSMDKVDPALDPASAGQFVFNDSNNAVYSTIG